MQELRKKFIQVTPSLTAALAGSRHDSDARSWVAEETPQGEMEVWLVAGRGRCGLALGQVTAAFCSRGWASHSPTADSVAESAARGLVYFPSSFSLLVPASLVSRISADFDECSSASPSSQPTAAATTYVFTFFGLLFSCFCWLPYMPHDLAKYKVK